MFILNLLFLIAFSFGAVDYTPVVAKITGAPDHVARMVRLVGQVEVVINSEKFESRVLGAYYNGRPGFMGSTLSPKEVLAAVRAGNELKSGNNGVWELDIEVKKTKCSTLGWTYSTKPRLWINTCGFSKRADSGIAGTIGHEQMHKLGFKHSKWNIPGRDKSVPYAIGTIVAETYKELFPGDG